MSEKKNIKNIVEETKTEVLEGEDSSSNTKKNQKKNQIHIEKKKIPFDKRPYVAVGILALVIMLMGCVCVTVFFKFGVIKNFFNVLSNALQPVIIGLVIAYLINPVQNVLESLWLNFILPKVKDKNEAKVKKMSRVVLSVITVVIFLIFIGGLILIMIPSLSESLVSLYSSMSGWAQQLIDYYNNLTNHGEETDITVFEEYFIQGIDYVENWMATSLLPNITSYASTVKDGVITVFNFLKNLLIGVIIAILALTEKDNFKGLAKKFLYGVFPVKTANYCIATIHKSDKIFGGFIVGKLLDSLIIGIITFIVLSIIKMPYVMLISVIIGITNIVPAFGPFIGAVPCLIIIVMEDPTKALAFLIFVVVLQTLDGYVIGPKILGDSTGMSSFWVIVAILLFAGLMGFSGLVIGVPLFALIWYLLREFFDYLLKKKSLPLKTSKYTNVTHVDPKTMELCESDWEEYRVTKESAVKHAEERKNKKADKQKKTDKK